MRKFRVTYVRTCYMEVEVAAEDYRQAEAQFESLAAAAPFACDGGNTLTAPRYRVVDVTTVDPSGSARAAAEPTASKPAPDPMVAHELFRKMLAQQGIDLTGGWWRGFEAMMFHAFDRCIQCRCTALCERWLDRNEARSYPSFCPSTRIIEACRILDPDAPARIGEAGDSIRGEPPMAELLEEPIVRQLMRADGVTDATLLLAPRQCS